MNRLYSLLLLLLVTAPAAAQNPNYNMRLNAANTGQGGCAVVEVILDNVSGAAVCGWQVSVCHDDNQLEFIDLEPGSAADVALNGQPPFFFAFMEHAGQGFLSGLVLDAYTPAAVQPGAGHQLLVAEYEALAPNGTNAPLSFCTVGAISVGLTVTLGGAATTIPPVTTNDTIAIGGPVASCGVAFIRGDSNDDGAVNVADPVFSLTTLFNNGPEANCVKASDSNDDGVVNIADPIFALNTLFQMGGPIPAPFPTCGDDATADALLCDQSSCP